MKKHLIVASTGWLPIGALVLLVCMSCSAHQTALTNFPLNHPSAFQGDFIARVYSVEPGSDDVFVAHLHDCYMPVWQELRKNGVITSVSVFDLQPLDSAIPETPAWRFLLLAQLGSRANPDDLLKAERAACFGEPSHGSPFRVLREERMTCTPNSCYKIPESRYQDEPAGIDFLVEFIAVEDSPLFLEKYRDLMSRFFGPANGILVEQGTLHSFIALETSAVLSEVNGVPAWNQLHISDDWDVNEEVDWDAVYSELFRREFSRELDAVWAEMPPVHERPINYCGRLVRALVVR